MHAPAGVRLSARRHCSAAPGPKPSRCSQSGIANVQPEASQFARPGATNLQPAKALLKAVSPMGRAGTCQETGCSQTSKVACLPQSLQRLCRAKADAAGNQGQRGLQSLQRLRRVFASHLAVPSCPPQRMASLQRRAWPSHPNPQERTSLEPAKASSRLPGKVVLALGRAGTRQGTGSTTHVASMSQSLQRLRRATREQRQQPATKGQLRPQSLQRLRRVFASHLARFSVLVARYECVQNRSISGPGHPAPWPGSSALEAPTIAPAAALQHLLGLQRAPCGSKTAPRPRPPRRSHAQVAGALSGSRLQRDAGEAEEAAESVDEAPCCWP